MGWIILLVIIAVVVLVIIEMNIQRNIKEETKKNEQSIFEELKKQHNFQESKCLTLGLRKIRIDESNKNIAICYDDANKYYIVPFTKVSDVSIYEDGVEGKKSGISRAIVGGILAGGAGAVVGSSTAKSEKFINSYGLRVYTIDISNPLYYFPMIAQETKKDSVEFMVAESSANQAYAVIKAIIKQND